MNRQDRILTGIALMLGFCFMAPLIDVASKLAAQEVPVGTVTLGRFVVQAALMAPALWFMGLSFGMPRNAHVLGLSIARAGFSVLATFCFVAAVQVMPIADALAIAFVEPFVILLIGRFVMGEEVGPRRLGAAVVGFIGALFVIQPSFAAFGAVALFPLGTAVTFAAYMLVTRALSAHLHPVQMQFQTAVIAALICLPALWLGGAFGFAEIRFELPTGIFWIWVGCVGLMATISHMAMSYALSFAPSSTLAPLHYFEMLTATLFGYVFFEDFPNLATWTGIAIITGSGLYIIHRERAMQAAARRAQQADIASEAAQAPIRSGSGAMGH